MKIIAYLSNLAIPMMILTILVYGLKEKINIFDFFLEGAKEGINIVIKVFPTLVGLFVAISALRASGILDNCIKIILPITEIFNIPKEVLPLMFIKPISGSAALATGTDIMKTYGVDSKIGLIASTIMGSTETTIYIVAVYSSYVGIKKTRFVLLAALLGDVIGMLISVVFWGKMS